MWRTLPLFQLQTMFRDRISSENSLFIHYSLYYHLITTTPIIISIVNIKIQNLNCVSKISWCPFKGQFVKYC